MKAPTRRRLTPVHAKLQVRAETLEFPPKCVTTARVRGQNPFSSAWGHMASGVSLGSHDGSDDDHEASCGKALEGFGGQEQLLPPQTCLLPPKVQARPYAFHVLEKLKPH